MSGGVFFALMIPPALISWFISIYYINFMRIRTIQLEILNAVNAVIEDKNVMNKNPLLEQDRHLVQHSHPQNSYSTRVDDEESQAASADSAEVSSKVAEQIGHQSWVAFPFFALLIILELVG